MTFIFISSWNNFRYFHEFLQEKRHYSSLKMLQTLFSICDSVAYLSFYPQISLCAFTFFSLSLTAAELIQDGDGRKLWGKDHLPLWLCQESRKEILKQSLMLELFFQSAIQPLILVEFWMAERIRLKYVAPAQGDLRPRNEDQGLLGNKETPFHVLSLRILWLRK